VTDKHAPAWRADRTIADSVIGGLTLAAIGCALFYNGRDLVLYAVACTLMIAALAATVWWRRPPTAEPRLGPAGCAFALLFVWSALAIGWSVVPYLSVIDLGILGAGFAGYLVWRVLLPEPRGQSLAAYGLGVLAVAIAVAMLTQAGLGLRPSATFLNPNSAAGFVNLLWPIPAALALAGGYGQRRIGVLLALTALLVFAVGIDGSRAAGIGALVALAVIVVAGRRLQGNWRPVLIVAAVVVAALAAAHIANLLGFGGRGEGLAGRLASLGDPGEAGGSRWPIWRATWALIQEAPWLGHGPGTFYQAYAAHRLPADGTAGFFAHNDYLQYFAERGLPGLLLLLALAGGCAWLYLRGVRDRAMVVAPVMMIAAAAALASAAVHALFSYNLHVMPFVIVFGIAIAALETAVPSLGVLRLPVTATRARIVPAVGLIAVLVLSVLHLALAGATYRYTLGAAQHVNAKSYDLASQDYATARRLWDAPDPAWGGHADLYRRVLEQLPAEREGLRRSAKAEGLRLLEGAHERNPLRAGTPAIRGELLLQSPGRDVEAAQAAFERALRLDPRSVRARLNLARLHRDAGRIEAAAELIDAALELNWGRRDPLPLMHFGLGLRRAAGDSEGVRTLERQIREHSANNQRIPESR
jgi:O-antigen ligase